MQEEVARTITVFATAWLSTVAQIRLPLDDNAFTSVDLACGRVTALCAPPPVTDGDPRTHVQAGLFNFLTGPVRTVLQRASSTSPVSLRLRVAPGEIYEVKVVLDQSDQSACCSHAQRSVMRTAVRCAIRALICYANTIDRQTNMEDLCAETSILHADQAALDTNPAPGTIIAYRHLGTNKTKRPKMMSLQGMTAINLSKVRLPSCCVHCIIYTNEQDK